MSTPTENDSTPEIADFAATIAQETRDVTDWRIYENDVYAQVFEYTEHRRLQIWQEEDLMGDVAGYSWQEQLWTGTEWADLTEISTDHEVRTITATELRGILENFRISAEATRIENLTPTEAALDHNTRRAIAATARLQSKVTQLQKKLAETTEKLDTAVNENTRIRTAIGALGRKIGLTSPTRDSRPDNTGPTTNSPRADTSGPAL